MATDRGDTEGANDALVAAMREALARLADPTKAPAMQAYMKSAMPFYGVQAPQLHATCGEVFAAHPLGTCGEWRATVVALWRGAPYREERYAALALAGDRRYRACQRLDTLPMYEEMIVTGAWWDYVDDIAIHRVGELLRREPMPLRAAMLEWATDPNPWKRRTAILCQNAFGAATDEALLFACIAPSLRDPDFFLRKAIGWALREYARMNPAAVLAYVRAHEGEMSPLSRREALKHLRDQP